MKNKRKNVSNCTSEQLSYTNMLIRAERTSKKMLGVSFAHALEMLKNGDLRDTIAEVELISLKFLLSA